MRIAVFGTVVAALAVGHLFGVDSVASVHGHPNLGGPLVYGIVVPELPQGAF